ncbi:MAG TPA: flagellar hook-associated protein FlgL [bacterium]|jgi:flagellar hook-associated protein 3 FlgL|nr:flagellar hook-associated protein FlgL [Dictyoglomota bacterium]HHV80882.1 flagellar hook-associated protein FlgL [bacterium]HOP55880.1 flagellar hook-associated protein FlgL [bacterium]
MRITYNMTANTVLRNLSNNLTRIEKLQDQLSSGKKVSRPSDDPLATIKIMEYRTTLSANSQYTRNTDFLKTELEVADKSLQDISSTLNRVKTLAVRGASESLPQSSRDAIAEELDQLIDHLIQVANTDVSGKYIFGGYRTTIPPLERQGDVINYRGDNNVRMVEISKDVTIETTPTGKTLFVDTGMFEHLISLKNALLGGDTSQINEEMGNLDKIMDRVNAENSSLGARLSRIEFNSNLISDKNVRYTDLLSKQEDIEIEDVVLKLYSQQNIYQASLIAAARVLQPSLIDHLG